MARKVADVLWEMLESAGASVITTVERDVHLV
jgi:hypothetical protein